MGVVRPDWTTPSDQLTVHGGTPVKVAFTDVDPPAQTDAVPDTLAVGFWDTVTTAEPEPTAEQ